MKTMHKIKTVATMLAFAAFLLAGCKKERLADPATMSSSGSAEMRESIPVPPIGNAAITLKVENTSKKSNYGAVNVEIIGAVIHYSDKKMGFVGYATIPVHAGIYNLLEIGQNAKIFAEGGNLPAASIDQVRLILGIHNSVVIGTSLGRFEYPLLMHGANNFVNVPVRTTLMANHNVSLTFDFHALNSISAEQEAEGHIAGEMSTQTNKKLFFLEPSVTWATNFQP